MYLETFELPTVGWEEQFLSNEVRLKLTYHTSVYPFQIFPQKCLTEINFEPITFFYGGNGSGKTTLLNIIAEKLQLERGTFFNRSEFFDDYAEKCEFWMPRYSSGIPRESRIITSDDVFDYLLDVRCLNDKVDRKRDELMEEYMEEKYSSFQMKSMEDIEKLRRHNAARKKYGFKIRKKQGNEYCPGEV